MGRLVSEYCSNSSIHGVSYIGSSSRRSRWERFWWFVMLLLSSVGCGILIAGVYHKRKNNPVILSFDERLIPVQQIPFPAVTICPYIQYRPELIDAMHRYWKDDIIDEETEILVDILHGSPCDEQIFPKRNLSDRISLAERMLELFSGYPNQTIAFCRFKNLRCEEQFRPTITSAGVCYSYNLMSADAIFRTQNIKSNQFDWLSQLLNWSTARLGGQTNPVTAFGSGWQAGMSLELQDPVDESSLQCWKTSGFIVQLHSPTEYPLLRRTYVHLKHNHDLMITVRPEIITTSKDLLGYSPESRQCFFSQERALRFFVIYSQVNCELECYVNYTIEHCGCARIFMPRDNHAKICELTQESKCWIYETYLASEYKQRCECLPGCNSIEYDAGFVQTIIPHSANDSENGYQHSTVKIYFNQNQFMGLKRTELFGWTDFIANCGGVLGLCMGVSLLSLAELLYYCLVRPILKVYQHHRRGTVGELHVMESGATDGGIGGDGSKVHAVAVKHRRGSC